MSLCHILSYVCVKCVVGGYPWIMYGRRVERTGGDNQTNSCTCPIPQSPWSTHTSSWSEKLKNRQTDKQTNKQNDKKRKRQKDKQKNRQTDKNTNRQTDTPVPSCVLLVKCNSLQRADSVCIARWTAGCQIFSEM